MNAFETVLANMKRLGMVPAAFEGTPMKSQAHATTQTLQILEPVPVRTLQTHPRPAVLLRSGAHAKQQPPPFEVGDTVYAKLMPDGLIKLMPFKRAGAGYEMVKDAREGEHFEFIC